MSFKKLLVCVTLVCALLLPQLGAFSQAANSDETEEMIAVRLEHYKKHVYPNGWYWAGGNMDSSTPRPSGGCSNVFNRATECHAFALKLASLLWGSYPTPNLWEYRDGLTSGNWTCYTRSARGVAGLEEIGLRPGDVIRAGYGSYSNGHTAVVWKVEGGKVWFAEAWGSYSCRINWGGFNYYHYTLKDICSRYSQVAIWRYEEKTATETAIEEGSGIFPFGAVDSYLYSGTNPFDKTVDRHALTLKLAEMVWGSAPTAPVSKYRDGLTEGGWTCYTRASQGVAGMTEIGFEPGDVVRVGTSMYLTEGHTSIVWKVEDDKIYFTEAWGESRGVTGVGGFNYYVVTADELFELYPHMAIWRYEAVAPAGETALTARYAGIETDPLPEDISMLLDK